MFSNTFTEFESLVLNNGKKLSFSNFCYGIIERKYGDKMKKSSIKDKLNAYALKKYNAPKEHLWVKNPSYYVFRRNDNDKWFGLVMTFPRKNLKIGDDTPVDILTFKVPNQTAFDALTHQVGFFPGYPNTGHGHWVSVLLDGTVGLREIYKCLDESYKITAPKIIKK